MLLNNRCWNWSLDKVERSTNTSMCPPRSTPPSSPPIPRALTSTATSSPDSTVIIGFHPNRNSSAAPTIKCSLIPTWTSIEHLSHHPPSLRPSPNGHLLRGGG